MTMQNLDAAVFVAAVVVALVALFWRVVLVMMLVFCLTVFIVGIASVVLVVKGGIHPGG
jgi:hypothetical protein